MNKQDLTPDKTVADFYLTDGDSHQYCRRISDTEYEFTQIQCLDALPKTDKQYVVLHGTYNVAAMTMDKLETTISGFYLSLQDFLESYNTLMVKDLCQLIAECAFENDTTNNSISLSMSLEDCVNFQKYKMIEWSQD